MLFFEQRRSGLPNIFVVNGYRFFFFSNDGDEPIHVHVEKAGKYAKFWVNPVSLANSYRYTAVELTKIRKIIKSRKNEIEEKWHDYFNQ